MARQKNRSSKSSGQSFIGLVFSLLRAAIVVVLLGTLAVIGYFAASIYKDVSSLPDITLLEKYEPIEAIQIFDRNDKLVAVVEGDEDRRVVPLNQISIQMQQAMLAAEDHHFYEHHGVNPLSIFRALMANLHAGHVVEGGSTITQQLVKNLFFEDPKRNLDRKVKEAFMSFEIERRYTKERILEMYLNQVYFGNNAYGIERAAYRYFNKSAAKLSLPESAFLAGLVKAPSELGAEQNRKLALSRMRDILSKMVEYGYVTKDQEKKALSQELVFKRGENPLQKYSYYISYVLQILRNRFSEAEIRRQGLRVYTNLDPVAQEIGEKVLNDDIAKAPKGVSQGALVSVTVPDAAVIAIVGGVGDFWKNQWNRATNPHTAGSSFKPFVYLTGFMQGKITPDTVIVDEPLTIKQPWGLPPYSPKNFDHKYLGKMTIRRALTLSRNVISVKIAQMVGITNVVETARLAGITAKLDPNLSLALGSSAISPLDLAVAYSTIARGGVAVKPQVIRRVDDNKGRVLETFEYRREKVFELNPVAQLVDIMQDVVRIGTGTMAKLPDRPCAGKTGTADESKDIWFIGFTPDLVTACWGGNDDNLPIAGANVTGGSVMAKIWRDYNTRYYQTHAMPPGQFLAPAKVLPQDQQIKDEKVDNSTFGQGSAPEPIPYQGGPLPSPSPKVFNATGGDLSTPLEGDTTSPTFYSSPHNGIQSKDNAFNSKPNSQPTSQGAPVPTSVNQSPLPAPGFIQQHGSGPGQNNMPGIQSYPAQKSPTQVSPTSMQNNLAPPIPANNSPYQPLSPKQNSPKFLPGPTNGPYMPVQPHGGQ